MRVSRTAASRVYWLMVFMIIPFASTLVAWGQAAGASREGEAAPPAQAPRVTYHSAPYCGVGCLYVAMGKIGHKTSFIELLRPEYVESSKGSSLAGLKKGAEDNGLHAVSLKNGDSRLLRHCADPVILRVKSNIDKKAYDHYVLFHGIESGKAKVFDPPNQLKVLSFNELAPLWNGYGLVVSAAPINLNRVFAPTLKRLAGYAAIGIGMVLLTHATKRWLLPTLLMSRWLIIGLSIGQGVALGIAALLAGLLCHLSHDEGLLANAQVTRAIQQAHAGDFIPKVSARAVVEMLGSDAPVLVDARYKRDFEAGHLEGAISVPVNATDEVTQTTLTGVAKNAKIVVYCQSAGCPFARKVAVKLKGDGFSDVSIFKGAGTSGLPSTPRGRSLSHEAVAVPPPDMDRGIHVCHASGTRLYVPVERAAQDSPAL